MFRIKFNYKKGFSLIEIVVGAALILILATLFTGAVLYGEESGSIAGQRNRANLIAEEGLEAMRSLRDKSYSNLFNGTYGITQANNIWATTTGTDIQDIFTRRITVSTVDAVTKQVVSTVTWPQNAIRNGTTTLITYLTNTQLLFPQSKALAVTTTGASFGGTGSSELNGITLQNISSSDISISKISVSWTNATRRIQEVNVNNTKIWASTGGIGTPTGNQVSGTELNVVDYVLPGGTLATVPLTRLLFNGNMNTNTITILFTMLDGSTKTIVTSP